MSRVQFILVCRLSALGDIVLTLPALEALREEFPDARLEFLSREPHGRVLRDVTHVDDVHLWAGPGHPLPGAVASRRWDLLIDLSGTATSRRLLAGVRAGRRLRVAKQSLKRWAFVHLRRLGGGSVRLLPVVDRMFSCLERLGIGRDGRVPRFEVPRASADGPVVIAPGAGRATKEWPAERFAEVARALTGAGRGVLLLGTARERALLERIAGDAPGVDVVAGPDPGDLPAIVARGVVALVNDSAILHVAEACGVPVVALFGPTHPRLGFAPLRPDSAVLHTGIACSPCDLHGSDRCPRGHHRCLQDIAVERVLAEVRSRVPEGALP